MRPFCFPDSALGVPSIFFLMLHPLAAGPWHASQSVTKYLAPSALADPLHLDTRVHQQLGEAVLPEQMQKTDHKQG